MIVEIYFELNKFIFSILTSHYYILSCLCNTQLLKINQLHLATQTLFKFPFHVLFFVGSELSNEC